MKFRNNKGFTLIELLVVIAIIGILSSVVLASLNSARMKSRDAKRVSDIKQFQLALEMYFDDNGAYPDALLDLVPNHVPAIPNDPTNQVYNYEGYETGPGASCVDYSIWIALEGVAADQGVRSTDADADRTAVASPICTGGANSVFDDTGDAAFYDVRP